MPAPLSRLLSSPDPSFQHRLYENNPRSFFTYLPHHTNPWHSHQVHLFPSNPYPAPPPPIAHKVWLLNCKSCGMFLTNRGMKAVLLLRPNVSLFSSDALPANCSAYSSNPDALCSPAVNKSTLSPVPPRTCECLTQTLCCHGCGNTIGYMIVIPCTRCTSSITATNRATNGHRFVFHSGEVEGTERHYIKDEPGVVPVDLSPAIVPSPQIIPPLPVAYPSPHYSPDPLFHNGEHSNGRESPPIFRDDFLPTPPLEFAGPILASSRHHPSDPDSAPQYYRMHFAPYHSRSPPPVAPVQPQYHPSTPRSPSTAYSDSSSPPPLVSSNFYSADQKDPLIVLPALKAGDVIFWHHLSRSGEIPEVNDDTRARRPASKFAAGEMYFNR
ncbi:hypothetical protein B0H34DRAFT_746903 [Crassisporium funariophilum]|nr:hypothetical protein B0H34DRAFT_746903 [Crassisporium funariophilum]